MDVGYCCVVLLDQTYSVLSFAHQAVLYDLGGHTYTLADIEHRVLRSAGGRLTLPSLVRKLIIGQGQFPTHDPRRQFTGMVVSIAAEL